MAVTEPANTPPDSDLIYEKLPLIVDGVHLSLSTVRRPGSPLLAPILFLHGFGSTKEDYTDLAHHPSFASRLFLAYDAAGCGATTCADLSHLSIPFLAATAAAFIQHHALPPFHLVGHSMGGLTALLLATTTTVPILSFTNIEGNLAPEDCFLSRQILTHADPSPSGFLTAFAERARRAPQSASALYAAALPHKVRAEAVRGIFESMVRMSDGEDLMGWFLALECPRMFVYGEQNAGLSYLGRLRGEEGVEVAEVGAAGHWPMYSNPVEMWRRLEGFLRRVEG